MIRNRATNTKGSSWLVSPRHVVTNEHVVRGATESDLEVAFATGLTSRPSCIAALDVDLDLAVLELATSQTMDAIKLDLRQPNVGTCVHAWGFPLAYSGPAPILSVGYLAGFEARILNGVTRRRMVINGALNPGNSGGPIVDPSTGALLGVAVTKHAPFPQAIREALEDLSQREEGLYADNPRGGPSRNESQIIADVLNHLRTLTQVVIGEAIPAEDVSQFLTAKTIPWQRVA